MLDNKKLNELEKLIGIKTPQTPKGGIENLAKDIVKGADKKQNSQTETPHDRYWEIQKLFIAMHDKHGKDFAFFLADLLDILIDGEMQHKFVMEMFDAKTKNMKQIAAKAADGTSQEKERARKLLNQTMQIAKAEVGGSKRVFTTHFIKRKRLITEIFLNTLEYETCKKLIKHIENTCSEILEDEIPETREKRLETLNEILDNLRYETCEKDVYKIWAILDADNFKYLEEVFFKSKEIYLVRPDFYDDLDKTYREGKNLIKLLLKDLEDSEDLDSAKQEIYISYLQDIRDIYTHHHFVLKHYYSTRPRKSKKELEDETDEFNEKISELREQIAEMREENEELQISCDQAKASERFCKAECADLEQKLKKYNPGEVRKQLNSAEAKVNAMEKELKATLLEDAELRTDFMELAEENQKLLEELQNLNALPDESAYSVNDMLKNKRVVIFGGVGRDHYAAVLKEAGVKYEDYEWYDGYHTISQARTAEIVGRADLIVVVTSYAGHLLLYQVRPCIEKHQLFLKIHSSGAGSLKKEIRNHYSKK
ncbi:MAG: hypothetical protein GX221_05340 [Candidatus Riflebacteria bacterium]|nr:hypothetical protein [Candidatus Riflebacteria bacterium]